jgi:hypothetical protein
MLPLRGSLTLSAIQFQAVANEIVTQLRRNLGLQAFDLLRPKLQYLTGIQVDQVIVMRHVRSLKPRRCSLEDVSLYDTLPFEHQQRPVDGRQRYGWVNHLGPPVEFVGIRMIFGGGEDTKERRPLVGHPDAFDPQRRSQLPCSVCNVNHTETIAR